MDAPVSLVLDMLEWIEKEPRPYRDVMNAWRTSCPRLTVWEDALSYGFVRTCTSRNGAVVSLTDKGRDFLKRWRAVT